MSQGFSTMIQRTLLALGVMGALLAFAPSASAGPLCDELATEFGFDFGETPDDPVDEGDGIVCRNFTSTNNAAYYLFDVGGFEHLLRITVEAVVESFGLAFERIFHPDDFDFGVPGYTCLAYGPEGQCVEYQSLNNPEQGFDGDYFGDVTWLISWTPSIGTENGEIVHAPGDSNDFAILTEDRFFDPVRGPRSYDCDNPYTQNCDEVVIGVDLLSAFKEGGPGDPTRAASSNNFSSAGVVEPLPEPGTLALLGLAATGFVLNRRRRNGNGRD